MDIPCAHLLLRDRLNWHGRLRGLRIGADGTLALSRVPGPADGQGVRIEAAYPALREVSGLALGPCEAVFVADTAHDRVVFEDRLCARTLWLPIDCTAPRGLGIGEAALWVADGGHLRMQGLALPELEPHLRWGSGMPWTSAAVDAQGRLLAVDAAAARLHRWSRDGTADAAFEGAVAAVLAGTGQATQPHQVAVGADDTAWLSDAAANTVWVFSSNGTLLYELAGPAGWRPGAVAVQGQRAFVADASNGSIQLFDAAVPLGALPLWQGPVTALAVHSQGHLFIKPGLDARYIRFDAEASCLAEGELEAGPFDAGEERSWERAWWESATESGNPVPPPKTANVTLSVALTPLALPAPAPTDWRALPGSDALLAPDAAAADPARFVWLRLAVRADSAQASPRIAQVRCATAAENLLNYLPQTCAIADGVNGFLARWLQLLRGEYGRVEELIDDMPLQNDPGFTPAGNLPWLAAWLALELPRVAGNDERRQYIARALRLHSRRGTPASISDFVELHTGIRPAIVEAFIGRRIFALDAGCRLDFESRLPCLDPHGMVVPEVEDACAHGSAGGPGPIGRIVVGESGPLLSRQIGQPQYDDEAWRFCVVVDAYRASRPGVLQELQRIVNREKPAHTDWRIALVQPQMRVGLQSRVGIDTIVGGTPPRIWYGALGVDTALAEQASGRIGDQVLDGTLTLL